MVVLCVVRDGNKMAGSEQGEKYQELYLNLHFLFCHFADNKEESTSLVLNV